MWEYVSAEKVNDMQVCVVIQRPPRGEETEPVQEVLTWTKDDDMTWNQFYAMVRRQVKNYLAHLNAAESPTVKDLTDFLRPGA